MFRFQGGLIGLRFRDSRFDFEHFKGSRFCKENGKMFLSGPQLIVLFVEFLRDPGLGSRFWDAGCQDLGIRVQCFEFRVQGFLGCRA